MLLVHVSMAALMVGWPQASTNSTRNKYGAHAVKTSRPGWRLKTAASGLSVSRRMMVFGRQNLTMRPVTTMHVSELTMSVSSGPTKFDTRNCMLANDTPHATIAGQTSKARANPAITTIRYAGMNTETIAHRRPTIALNDISGSPVVPASVTSGIPIEPNATGAVLARRQMPAA